MQLPKFQPPGSPAIYDPHIYAIACLELPERWKAIDDHLRSKFFPDDYTIVRSIHGKTWGLETVKEFEPGQRISAGHVGLLLGHWFAWQLAYNKATTLDGVAIFLEDDAVLVDDFDTQLATVFGNLNEHLPNWELCFLGLAEPDGPKIWNKITERVGPANSPLCRLAWPWGTHGYMVRNHALPRLMNLMTAAERNMDQQLYLRVLKDNHVNWCAVVPPIVHQRTYDYAGTGSPEWAPSTIDPPRPPQTGMATIPVQGLTETEAQRLAGRKMPPPPTQELLNATLAIVSPFPCIYRGEGLDDHGRSMKTGKTVPVDECVRFGVRCHSRTGEVVGVVRTDIGIAMPCETCAARLGMLPAAQKRDRLPLPEGHFNPSFLMWQGRLVLATRDSWGHSRVSLWYLDNTQPDWLGEWSVTQIGSYASAHPEAPRLEDPRLFIATNDDGELRLHAMFNLPDGYPPKRVQVGYCRFSENLTGIEHTEVFASPAGNAYEKNWVPLVYHHFSKSASIQWVYGMKPEHVILNDDTEPESTYRTPNPLPWSGGAMRGGAAPIYLPDTDELIHFFHGCLKRVQGSVYSVGAYISSPRPPFRILRQTKAPLIWPNLPAVGEDVVKRYVVWPGGAVLHQGRFFLALGVDDCHCKVVSLSFDEVMSAMNRVPETTSSVSIRDTPVCRGVKASEVKP